MNKKIVIISILILFLLSFFVYQNSIHNEFVFDDYEQIENNPWIRDVRFIPKIFTSGVWSFREFTDDNGIYYRPLMHIVFMGEYYFFGLNSAGYHFINILIHFFNSVLFFLLLLIIFKKLFPGGQIRTIREDIYTLALLAAILFALHPINSETINWISAIPELTFTLFYLLSLFFYFLPKLTKINKLISILFFSLSLLCKETAVTLPVFLFFYNFSIYLRSEKKLFIRARKCFFRIAPYILITLIYILIRQLILKTGVGIDKINISIAATVVPISSASLFLKNIIEISFPFKLSIFHSYHIDDTKILSVAFATALAAVYSYLVFKSILKIRINAIILLGFFLFAVPLLPALNLIFLKGFVLSERYLYLPSMGFALLTAFTLLWMLAGIKKEMVRKIIFTVAISMLLGVFSVIIIKRNGVWNNELSIFSDAVAKYPDSPLAQLKLAETYCKIGNIKKCDNHYRIYCTILVSSDLSAVNGCLANSNYHNVLGDAYLNQHDFYAAIEQYQFSPFQSALPQSEKYMNLGRAFARIGDPQHAQKYFESALKLNANSSVINLNVGSFYCSQGNADLANQYFTEALKLGKSVEEIQQVQGECAGISSERLQ